MVSTPVIHVITWITTHLPTPKGWKAELAWPWQVYCTRTLGFRLYSSDFTNNYVHTGPTS